MGLAGSFEQADQPLKLRFRQMAQLPLVHLAHRFGQRVKQIRPPYVKCNVDDTQTQRLTLPSEVPSRLKARDNAGDVGGLGNQAVLQFEGWHGSGMGFGQQAEQVVLLGCEFHGAEDFVLERLELVVGSPEMQEGLLLQRIERWSSDLGRC